MPQRHNLKLFDNVHLDVTQVSRAFRIPAGFESDTQAPRAYPYWVLFMKDYDASGQQVRIELTADGSRQYDRFARYPWSRR